MNKFDAHQRFSSNISRREFVHYFGLGLFGLMLPKPLRFASPEPGFNHGKLLGRVTRAGVMLHHSPDSHSKVIQEMEADSIWRITGAPLSENEESANRVWYKLEDIGFAHSRFIQPVQVQLNQPRKRIPEDGCLGEITMPFVDAYSSVDKDRKIVYRFYYSSTFWVLNYVQDNYKNNWYELLDDRTYQHYFVPADYVRIVAKSELTPISADVPPEDKKIVVDLATQWLTAYEGEKSVFRSRISSGVHLREGGYATPKGYYRVTRKRPCRHMANPANDYGSGFDLPGVPWVSYFTGSGIAFHGAYWHNDFGVPHSHGCINLTAPAAKWVYRWTTPTVPPQKYYYGEKTGTQVIVQ
jgi:hypothetical protein